MPLQKTDSIKSMQRQRKQRRAPPRRSQGRQLRRRPLTSTSADVMFTDPAPLLFPSQTRKYRPRTFWYPYFWLWWPAGSEQLEQREGEGVTSHRDHNNYRGKWRGEMEEETSLLFRLWNPVCLFSTCIYEEIKISIAFVYFMVSENTLQQYFCIFWKTVCNLTWMKAETWIPAWWVNARQNQVAPNRKTSRDKSRSSFQNEELPL